MTDDDYDDPDHLEDDYYESPVYFADCTCDHDPEEHDWIKCRIKGCDCKGHYEE